MASYQILAFFIFLKFLATYADISATWTKMSGGGVNISAKGSELWLTARDQTIWRYENKNWIRQGSELAISVGASPDGYTFIATKLGEILQWKVSASPKPNWFLKNIKRTWSSLKDPRPRPPVEVELYQISASDRNTAIAVGKDGLVWTIDGIDSPFRSPATAYWTNQPGIKAIWVAQGGKERWYISPQQEIYRWVSKDKWEKKPGGAIQIEVNDANRIVVVASDGTMYLWKSNNWQRLVGQPTLAKRASIGPDKVYYIDKNDGIYMAIV